MEVCLVPRMNKGQHHPRSVASSVRGTTDQMKGPRGILQVKNDACWLHRKLHSINACTTATPKTKTEVVCQVILVVSQVPFQSFKTCEHLFIKNVLII